MYIIFKHLDYRRAAKLREIRRMRAELFREINRYHLTRKPIPPTASASDTSSHLYCITYRHYSLRGYTSPYASVAADNLFLLRQHAFYLGLLRIQDVLKDM